jgi:hypothetical protein
VPIGTTQVFKKGDLFFLNTEGFILFQHIGGENGIIMSDPYLLFQCDFDDNRENIQFTGYDVLIKGILFKEIPEKFLERVTKNEKNIK